MTNSRYNVAALFVLKDSHYKTMPGVDCYDAERNALAFPDGMPVVAHPPCAGWGRMYKLATVQGTKEIMAYSPWAVEQVRLWGGVLEHPAYSKLWAYCDLPRPEQSEYDEYGGWTLDIDQRWFDFLAVKRTWLYICGIERVQLPTYTFTLDAVTHVIDTSAHAGRTKKFVTKKYRARTTPALAEFLVEIARRSNK